MSVKTYACFRTERTFSSTPHTATLARQDFEPNLMSTEEEDAGLQAHVMSPALSLGANCDIGDNDQESLALHPESCDRVGC